MLFISRKKLISFSRYLSFCLDFLAIYKNGLIRKTRLISKFMTSQPGSQTITIHILPSISRNKDNQTMKFGQLVEYNMQGPFQKVRARVRFFRKFQKMGKKKMLRKGKKFENLGKNVQNLKIFSRRAGDCVQSSHVINY